MLECEKLNGDDTIDESLNKTSPLLLLFKASEVTPEEVVCVSESGALLVQSVMLGLCAKNEDCEVVACCIFSVSGGRESNVVDLGDSIIASFAEKDTGWDLKFGDRNVTEFLPCSHEEGGEDSDDGNSAEAIWSSDSPLSFEKQNEGGKNVESPGELSAWFFEDHGMLALAVCILDSTSLFDEKLNEDGGGSDETPLVVSPPFLLSSLVDSGFLEDRMVEEAVLFDDHGIVYGDV